MDAEGPARGLPAGGEQIHVIVIVFSKAASHHRIADGGGRNCSNAMSLKSTRVVAALRYLSSGTRV
jgi:hypothetical protein